MKLLKALLLALFIATSARAELLWHWHDDFSASERAMLRDWLVAVDQGITTYIGPCPFDVHLNLHRRDGAREPVPWADTRRRPGSQQLNFYVDPDYPLSAFRSDWTATHEFAHLLIPYLGWRHSWFAEGLASYLQWDLLAAMGIIAEAEAERRRGDRLTRAGVALRGETRPLPALQSELRARGDYPTLYWAGAAYFQRVDARLRQEGGSLRQVLQRYLRCCRLDGGGLDAVVRALDAAGGKGHFAAELKLMRTSGAGALAYAGDS